MHALIAFQPLLPWEVLGPLFAAAAVATALALVRRARGAWLRLLLAAVFGLVLLNPALVNENREPVKDVAVVVVDQSSSQRLGQRTQRTEAALAALQNRLAAFDDLEVRVVRSAGAEGTGGDLSRIAETRLFGPLADALGDVPRKRRAGVILLTDGQVHDVPADPATAAEFGPVHTLLTGERRETDRRIEIDQAPLYGIVGRTVSVTVRVDDDPAEPGRMVDLQIGGGGGPQRTARIPAGLAVPFEFKLRHGGENVLELQVAPLEGELTLANNRTAAVVNAVRDRLRVLLVSGEPHPGERTWRSLLKADPSVDLVHFTILRPPEKQDGTPIRELSLIAFPIRELFEVKLNEFDLIIFDRYRQRGVLPPLYLENIAHYVEKGGALLDSSGPTFSTPFSLYRTPLGAILPAPPIGQVIERPFRPQVTDVGRRHPVTAGLPGANPGGVPEWGRWFRQNAVTATRGTTVMTGADDLPLLVLDRVGDGRIAQLASDHIWLWSRGFEGGGPHSELLRRLAHWLMKEPELEEEALRARAEGARLMVERQSLDPATPRVTVTAPDGTETVLPMSSGTDGRSTGSLAAPGPGVYRVSDGTRTALAVVGALNLPELAEVHTTQARLAPVAAATGGAVAWLADRDGAPPQIRRTRPDRVQSGPDWIGLRANGDYVVTGVSTVPLLPLLLVLLLVLGTMVTTWLRESR